MPCAGTLYTNPVLTPETFVVTGTTFPGASIELVACGSPAIAIAVAVAASFGAPVTSICTGAAASPGFTSFA